MAKPFKFRHVNEIAGAFAGFIVLVLVVGVVLAARAQKWFESTRRITIVMPAAGCFGLKTGADVHVMGATVGTVDRIDIDTRTGRMVAEVHVQPDFAEFIRIGADDIRSHVIIRVPIGIGDPFLDITRGQGPQLPQDGELIAESEVGAGDAINQTLVDVRTKTLPAVNAMIDEYKGVATDWRNPHGSVQEALARIDTAVGRLQQSDNALGRLINDRQAADDLSQTLTKLNTAAESTRATLADLQKTAAEFPRIAAGASAQVEKLPAMVDQTRLVMVEVEKAVHDLQATTVQLPAVVATIQQAVNQLPDTLAHVQQTLIEVQKLARGMQDLPFVRDNVDHTPQVTTLRPTDVGGPP